MPQTAREPREPPPARSASRTPHGSGQRTQRGRACGLAFRAVAVERRPKLIEVALPLAAISAEAAREKSIRHGHPSTLHLWWARRPLAAARAVIWASLVDDPSGDETLSAEEQQAERARLFGILERLVPWESSNDAGVLAEARVEIKRCFPDGAPPVLDPFAGGGAIPLEAQRLGLKALSGDLNPVAVLIQKAMIEIPPRFAGRAPVHPELRSEIGTWERAQGLAADVEAYGRWMREEAQRRIGHLYPDATGPNGEKLTPIAWIWARTVDSPDPAWRGHVPLVASWHLAKRKGKPPVWVEPIIDRETRTISYAVRTGGEPSLDRTVARGGGRCIATHAAITGDYVKAEGKAGRMGSQLMAVVAEGKRGRVYCQATDADSDAAGQAEPEWWPTASLPEKGLGFRVQAYGMDEWWKLFTPRQLTALTTFSDLLTEVRGMVESDAEAAGMAGDGVRLRDGGSGATAYADAVATCLAFAVDRCADYWSTICAWHNTGEKIGHTFGRQAIPITWDFAEANPFSDSSGNWTGQVGWVWKAIARLPATSPGEVVQRDARARVRENPGAVVCTDPPYYDNVGYADISDFFFVWLRRNVGEIWPDECATLMTPKAEEMIADPGRHGGPSEAEAHFEVGMKGFMAEVAKATTPDVPATIFYAYMATEADEGGVRSTGWDTFLQGVIDAGMQVTATWPLRTENPSRLRAMKSNALASSVVLACRPRPADAALGSRGEFVNALRDELPEAVRLLQQGNIAPVDMAQSTIGPGIGIFSRYARIIYADGRTMPVSEALTLINAVLGEIVDGEETELDADSRFAITWFEQHRFEPGPSGDADSVARAKNTSLSGILQSGIGETSAGKFRLYHRDELDEDWDPIQDDRLTVWEALQHLAATLWRSESQAAVLAERLGGVGYRARWLAYVLYEKANAMGWPEEAAVYNNLINVWSDFSRIAAALQREAEQQALDVP